MPELYPLLYIPRWRGFYLLIWAPCTTDRMGPRTFMASLAHHKHIRFVASTWVVKCGRWDTTQLQVAKQNKTPPTPKKHPEEKTLHNLQQWFSKLWFSIISGSWNEFYELWEHTHTHTNPCTRAKSAIEEKMPKDPACLRVNMIS